MACNNAARESQPGWSGVMPPHIGPISVQLLCGRRLPLDTTIIAQCRLSATNTGLAVWSLMWGPNTYDRPRIPRSSHCVAEDSVRGNIRLIPKNRHDILETLKWVVQDRLPVDVGAGRHM